MKKIGMQCSGKLLVALLGFALKPEIGLAAGPQASQEVVQVAAERPQENEEVLDQIVAIIYHVEGNELVLDSDRLGVLDGKPKSLREIVVEKLMLLDARRHKISVPEETLDRFIGQLLKNNGWSRFELIDFLEKRGYSFEEGRDLLRAQQMINQLLDYKIRADPRMVVERSEAKAYYDAQPSNVEATYTLQMAYIPFSKYPAKKIEEWIKKNQLPEDVVWDEPFTLKVSELEEDRLKLLRPTAGATPVAGQVVSFEKAVAENGDNGYELTRLVNSTAEQRISFDECYGEIVGRIRQERFSTVLENYHRELIERAHIVYCTDDHL